MKVSVDRDFIRDFGDNGDATLKSEQFYNNTGKTPHHRSNYDYEGDREERENQSIEFYPTRKYDIEVYTSKGTHPCGEDFESGFKQTTSSTSDVTYTSWTEERGRSETISTHCVTKSDYTEKTYATTGTGETKFNDPYITDKDKVESHQGYTFQQRATSSVDKKGFSRTAETKRRGINDDDPVSDEKTTNKYYLHTEKVTINNGGMTIEETSESPEYYSSKYKATDTSYSSSYWDGEASTTKKSTYVLMESGNLPVTTISCVPFNQFTTSSQSTTKQVDNDTSSVSYVATTISRITKDVKTLGTETDSVWTFWKDGKSSHKNAAFVKYFTLENDNPFSSFLCLGTKGFQSLLYDPFRSVTAKATLTPKVKGAWKSNKYDVVELVESKAYDNTYTKSAKDSFISNKVTTWKTEDVPQSANHPLCGVRDGTKEIVGERDRETFITMHSTNEDETQIYSADVPFLDRLEPIDFTSTTVIIEADTSTINIDGNVETIDYTTEEGSIRFTGIATTGTDNKGDLETTSSPTFYVNSPAGRVVQAGYSTYATKISIHQTSSSSQNTFLLPEIETPQTYNRVQLIGINVDYPDCFEEDEISLDTNTDPLEDSDYEVTSSTARSQTDPCETFKDFEDRVEDIDASNGAFKKSGRYNPITTNAVKTTIGLCDAYVFAKTEDVTLLKNSYDAYTMSFDLGSGISSSVLYQSGLVYSNTYRGTAVTKIQPENFHSLAYGYKVSREFKSTLTGLTTVPETSTKFSRSQKTQHTDKVFFSVNSCGYRFPVPEGRIRTITGIAWTFKPDPTVFSMYQKSENLGEGGVTVNNSDKYLYNYEMLDQDTFRIDDLYTRLLKQCHLEIHEPYVILKNHWQPYSNKGTDGDFFFSFDESNYQPVVQGGANFGGSVDHGTQSHSNFAYDDDVDFRGVYRGINQAWVPDIEKGYVISSSARSYTKYYYTEGNWSITTSTYMEQGSGRMPTVLTFSDKDLGQINMFGATRYGKGQDTDSETYLYSKEFDKFSETTSSSQTYESTTFSRGGEGYVTESTTATLYSVRWESLEFFDKKTFNSDYKPEIKTEFVEFGFRTLSPLAYYNNYYNNLAYSNSYDYPIADGGFPWERPYLIGGMYFNGSPKSATIISPFSNAAVEMYETINENGEIQTFSSVVDIEFSITTEGTARTIVQPAQCMDMQIKDNVKLEKCKPMSPIEYGGGARVNYMIDDFNAKLIDVPQQIAHSVGRPLTIGHNPVYREYGTVEESVGENCEEDV